MTALVALLLFILLAIVIVVAAEKHDEKQRTIEQGKVIIKTYRGSQTHSTRAFQADAAAMGARDYFPTSQSWALGQWSGSAYLFAVLLIFLFGLGLLILAYMLIVKPNGTLTVTYELQAAAPAEKTCPRCAETVKAAALVCRFCGHQFPPNLARTGA